ncbi:MAG TPA: 7-carboxy-7-deazaguanine synthase [Porphyromonadaceae bacterium]|nr:7-carboxy-7-deazaguanine synthase [Porphyromonadaceae bacterium]
MKINEIFYSLQGEGFHTGTPAVFVRFSGCNLRCPFCDTDHHQARGMSPQEILAEARQYPSRHVVFTGGEPALQLNAELLDLFHSAGYYIQIETNGTLPVPCESIDWITYSPKFEFTDIPAPLKIQRIDELKVVFDGRNDMSLYDTIACNHHSLQPCDTGDPTRNSAITAAAIDYCLRNPRWRLSLQTHKLLAIQ